MGCYGSFPGVNGGQVVFEANRLSPDYVLPAKVEFPISDPPAAMLSPEPDAILILTEKNIKDGREQILSCHRLGANGRRLSYPVRPAMYKYYGPFGPWQESGKEMGVLVFANGCWPILLSENSAHQESGIFTSKSETASKEYPFPPGARGIARIFLSSRGSKQPWAKDDDAIAFVREHADELARVVRRATELTESQKTAILQQIKEFAGRE